MRIFFDGYIERKWYSLILYFAFSCVWRTAYSFEARVSVWPTVFFAVVFLAIDRISPKRICKASGTVSKVFRWYSLWHAKHTHNRAKLNRTAIDWIPIMIVQHCKRRTQTMQMLKIIKIGPSDRARALVWNGKIPNWPSKFVQSTPAFVADPF